jgi:short-subunit dehydrogenase
MRERGHGQVALVASVAGYRGLPTAAAYSASKAAAIAMAESLRPELEPDGVLMQVVNPGFIKTPLTDKNDFPMPMLMDVEDATTKLVAGLGRTRFEIVFPRLFCWIVKLYRCMPYALAMRVARGMRKRT